jgi:hypothetical protein
MVGRLRFIAEAEGVQCDEPTLSQLILSSEGDMRRAIQVRGCLSDRRGSQARLSHAKLGGRMRAGPPSFIHTLAFPPSFIHTLASAPLACLRCETRVSIPRDPAQLSPHTFAHECGPNSCSSPAP